MINSLYLLIHLMIPVDLGLSHQHWYVSSKSVFIVVNVLLDALIVMFTP